MQNFKVSFYLRKSRMKKDGKTPIYIRLHLNRERIDVGSTGYSINESEWDNTKFRSNSRVAEALRLNNLLEALQAEFLQIFRRFEFNEELSLDLIKGQYLNSLAKTKDDTSFMDFFNRYIEESKEEIGKTHGKSTHTRYALTRKIFEEFLRFKYKRSDIQFRELNYNVIYDFERFLRVQKEYGNNNTLMKKMRVLKTVMISAQKRGELDHDPFVGYKIRFDQTDRGFLTDAEIEKIMNKEFSIKRLEVVRDIFIFSCFTGLAYIDVYNLTKENLVELDDKMWIMTKRQKTDVPSNILLLDIPYSIILRYEGKDKNGRLLPILSNQKMNSYLKEIADLCGIEKNLSYHVARHTFATLALSKGVPVESVSKMLGHTNIKTTQIYARITNKKIEHDMLALSEKLKGFGANK